MLEKSGKLYDVFMSYSSDDEEQIQRLISRLQAHGLKVWFAPYQIVGGDQFPEEIEQGLRRSQTVIAVLSPSSIQSFWVRQEWQIRLIQMSKDRTRKLIPLVLDECEIPLQLSTFQNVDFKDVDFDNQQILEDNVQTLVNTIKNVLPPKGIEVIGIPFVVIAMTHLDIENFGWYKTLPLKERKQFHQLLRALNFKSNHDIVDRYQDVAEGWKPFQGDNSTIRKIIENIIKWMNETHLNKSNLMIQPQYYSQDFFSEDDMIRRQIWHYLGHIGCVFVIDSISLFHPTIRRFFIDSQMGANHRVAFAGILPVNPRFIEANQILESTIFEQLPIIFDRYYSSMDPLCTFEIGNEVSFSRWLYGILPQTVEIIQKQRATPAMRQLLRNKAGQEPLGVFKLIYQMRESK